MNAVVKIQDAEWYGSVPRSIRKHMMIGLFLIALFFGGFGTWAATAPLAAAIISQGSFVATGKNKIVQHLEGGIIEEILVSEGDRVEKDEPLIRLDETAPLVKERQLFLRRARLEAVIARLEAEQAGRDEIVFPDMIRENLKNAKVAEIVEEQKASFHATREKLTSDISLLQHNIHSLEFRAEGFEALLASHHSQLDLLKQEHAGKKELFDQGLLRAPELRAVERAMADAMGNIGRLQAEISETRTQVEKHEQQIAQTRKAYRQTALDQFQSVAAELDTVREEARSARGVLDRVSIDAPVAGVVVRMHYYTPGGVIESGKNILEILPVDVPLIIETYILQNEIDSVKLGQPATIRLTALNRRTTPVLNGEVFYVSADSVPDNSTTGREAYVVRVKLEPSELERISGFAPTPGMPAEVHIQTAERTFLSYIVKPIRDSMSRAFAEQ